MWNSIYWYQYYQRDGRANLLVGDSDISAT
jgi:hypothetical protein